MVGYLFKFVFLCVYLLFCSDLRLTGYETLRLWITMVKAASGIDSQVNTLVPIIINDTTPVKNEINLTVILKTFVFVLF